MLLDDARSNSPDPSVNSSSTSNHFFPVEPYNESLEHIDTYLDRFERLARDFELPECKWLSRLIPALHGKSYETYSKLPVDQQNYTDLKSALLIRFELTADGYRKKFRNSRREKGETFTQFCDRIGSYFNKWITLSKANQTYDGLFNHLLLDQLMTAFPSVVRTFTTEQGATTLKEVTRMADRYLEAHENELQKKKSPQQSGNSDGKGKEHLKSNNTQSSSKPESETIKNEGHQQKRFCSFCRTKTHNTVDCRKKKAQGEGLSLQTEAPATSDSSKPNPPVKDQVEVNGKPAHCLYDTGLSFDAIVKESFICPDQLTHETISIQGVDCHSPAFQLPVAIIKVRSKYVTGTIKAAVMENPLYDLILGCRYVFLGTPPMGAAVAQTRAQVAEESKNTPTNPLPCQMKEDQEADPTLTTCFKKLPSVHTPPEKGEFFKKDGLIYRQTAYGDAQLVVPQKHRRQVLELGHSLPFSGHMGIGATTQRITAHYHWPGINADVQRFVKSCHQCQTMGGRSYVAPATLGEMPITSTPFQRVAVDLVGPLPLTKKKNRFILTLVDTCSMWPEAIPLPSIDSRRVADALVQIFTRLGFPEQILTDNGSQFTGKLMKEVYEILRVQHITTSVYHPQANGQVERFNGTLIGCLKKMVEEKPELWDTYLPAALFAYREVPHASTGLAPALLLFGRPIAGPLAALKRSWTDHQADENVQKASQYAMELKEKLQSTWKIATQTLKQARARQAKYYNKKAKDRELQVGDQVLLLLPCGSNKLEIRWQGPFEVQHKVSRTNYQILIHGKSKTYHINLLKKYHQQEELANPHLLALSIAEEVEGGDESSTEYPLVSKESYKDAVLDPALTTNQQQEVMEILQNHQATMTDVPGLTDLEQVSIKVTDPAPVWTRPYPVPLAKQESIRQEVNTLLEAGIISESESPYSAGVVLLRKPSGEHRLCVDFRKLNAVTEFQPEPIPDPLQIFAKISRAKYFSRIDLSKGFYQIKVPKALRPYLAFSTSDGHYEFNVMPFGLKNAPGIFSRMMRKLLAPMDTNMIHNFMDDILLATTTWEDHLTLLNALLNRLADSGLTARPTKCLIGFQELEFLGHTLKNGFIFPEEKNVEKMKDACRPKTKKDVRSFLGMCGFYQKFIPHFNTVAAPLSDLTKAKAPEKVEWNAACEKAFQELKEKLTSRPVLKLPSPEQPYILRTDASNTGIGSALLQADPEDPSILHPIAFASRKLNSAELNYATVEKECLALVWAIQKFQMYLYGKHFTVQTDHQPLTFLASSKQLNARLMRWTLLLQQYSFTVEYIKGTINHMADFLSRHAMQ